MRAAALLAVGALVLHQLSYRFAGSGTSLGGHSHSYLPFAAALAAVLMALACVGFIRTLVRALRGVHEQAPPRMRATVPVFTLGLVGVFGLQETIESWVTPGHPAGVAHVAEHIGWLGLVIALLLSTLISVLLRGTHAAVVALAQGRQKVPRPRPLLIFGRILPRRSSRRLHVLAGHLAGRAPPFLCREASTAAGLN